MRPSRAALFSLLSFVLGACDARPTHAPAAAPSVSARSVEVIRREGNRLVGQASPYLEQHAHNPVDWYPWGPEALERARREKKPIFVSIGYSTCHWCHVMEKESFEDEATARFLNERFVSIKIDREERPDLDALFIEAVLRLGEPAGWPLNLVLTPDLEPIFGGTYFPRIAIQGRPALMDVLREVHDRYREDGPAIARRGKDLLAKIAADARERGGNADVAPELLRTAMVVLGPERDTSEGGFGRRQKFPNAPLLLAELRFVERAGDAPDATELAVKQHLALTLDRLARGGVRDHLAGSFHRYAVDRAWRVPHFEKTLYDNAQLAALYVEASRALGDRSLETIARGVLDDLIARWQRPDGGFIVGFDADDAGGEGAYYTFTPAELERALGAADARLVGALFGVDAKGEPLLGGRSVLHRRDVTVVAREVGKTPAEIEAAWGRAQPLLFAMRNARPAPAADDKELAAWNGLAIAALADVGRALAEPRYVEAAQRAARFVIDRCWDAPARSMRRGVRRGAPLGEGFLDDYALPALALLRLHAADGDPGWLLHARAIADAIGERFHDAASDSFMRTALPPAPRAAEAEPLPLRRPDVDDGVLPSGSAAATLLFLELGAIAGDPALLDRGARALRAAAPRLREAPFSSGFLFVATDHALGDPREVVIAGDASDPRTRALVQELRGTTDARVLPVLLPASGAPADLARAFPALQGKVALRGKPTAFVCRRGACDAPTDDPAALRKKFGF
jgi:hypothetical protein